MAKMLFKNRASALLAGTIVPADLSLSVETGKGSLFPSPSGGDWFLATLEDASGATEVIKVTQRTGDVFNTIVRAQDSTTAPASWVQNVTRVELRTTAAVMEQFIQRSGDTMAGALNMGSNNVVDAHLTGSGTQMLAGEIVDVPLRGAVGVSTNEVRAPVGGGRATAGGAPIALQSEINLAVPIGTIVMWIGALEGASPSGFRPVGRNDWRLCDGGTYHTVTTPDMRDVFPFGAGGARSANSLVTAVAGTSGGGSPHGHTLTVAGHSLSVPELPAHFHGIPIYEEGSLGNNLVDVNGIFDSAPADTVSTLYPGKLTTNTTGSDLAHGHPGSTADNESAHTHSVPPISPTNRAVYFIMKVLATV